VIVAFDAGEVTLRLSLDPSSWVQRSMIEQLRAGGYEPGTWRVMKSLLRPGDQVIDVGAHVGVFSCLAAALVAPTGAVRAFEPNEANLGRLLLNRDMNRLSQMVVSAAVVSDRVGTALFWNNADNDGGHALWPVGRHPFNVQSTARGALPENRRCTSLDNYLAAGTTGVHPVRLIKIDTEGAELLVLIGASQILHKAKPWVIAEVNPFGLAQLGASEPALVEFMEERGYGAFRIFDNYQWLSPRMTEDADSSAAVYNLLFVPPGAELPCDR